MDGSMIDFDCKVSSVVANNEVRHTVRARANTYFCGIISLMVNLKIFPHEKKERAAVIVYTSLDILTILSIISCFFIELGNLLLYLNKAYS